MKALILFSTREGQTKTIASYIAETLQGTLDCDVVDLLHADAIDPAGYDLFMIGASVHYGHFHPALSKFIHRHLALLQQKPSAFFTVNLTARKPGKNTLQTNAYTRKFLLRSPWQPEVGAVFAGALRYPRYNWFDRIMIQFIMRMSGGETDASKEIEYTDWAQVAKFAREFSLLAPQKTA